MGDVHPGRIQGLTFQLRRAKTEGVKPGDVIAIPGPEGKYYLGVFITKNRIGHAFGFFHGLWPARPLKSDVILKPCGRPIYTDLHGLWDGTWLKVGESPRLLDHFDRDPEIYHKKRSHPENDAIGPFGAAERPSTCELRLIDEEEARTVGLLDNTYRQGELAKMIPKLLEKWNCQAQ